MPTTLIKVPSYYLGFYVILLKWLIQLFYWDLCHLPLLCIHKNIKYEQKCQWLRYSKNSSHKESNRPCNPGSSWEYRIWLLWRKINKDWIPSIISPKTVLSQEAVGVEHTKTGVCPYRASTHLATSKPENTPFPYTNHPTVSQVTFLSWCFTKIIFPVVSPPLLFKSVLVY